MGTVIEFPARARARHCFGGCPECGSPGEHISAGNDEHWLVCRKHRAKWLAAKDLFSDAREITPLERFRAVDILSLFREVTTT
jgi:hypothetical protein